MWRCSQCGEEVQDSFDLCWRCGTDRQGVRSDNFNPEPDDADVPDPGPEPSDAGQGNSVANAHAGSPCLTRLEIAELVCRVLALWLFAHVATAYLAVILLFLVAFSELSTERLLAGGLSMFLPLGGLAFGVVLWKNAKRIGRCMVANDASPIVAASIGRQDILTLACTMIGLYAAWASASELIRELALVAYTLPYFDLDAIMSDTAWRAKLTGHIGSFMIAMWLVLRSRWIVQRLERRADDASTADENADADEAQA